MGSTEISAFHETLHLQRNDLENMLLKIIPESEAAHAEARKEDSPREGSSKEGSPKDASNGPQNRPGNAASFSSGSESSKAGGPHSYDLKNSPLTFGDSSDNVYNYGSSTDGPASPLEANCALGSTPGSASASLTGGLTIIANNSPITLGNSFGNQYNYGSKESPSTAPQQHQPQDRVPNANGSGDHDQVSSQSTSSAQQGNHPSPPNPSTLKTPSDNCSHSLKVRADEAAQESCVIISSRPEMRMPVTGEASESSQSKLLSKMETERARMHETPTLAWPNIAASQPSGSVLADESSLEKASDNPDGNPNVESFSEGLTEEQKKEEDKTEVRADNYYQNCIVVQDSTNTDIIAIMSAKCRRNSGKNIRENIKKMITDKTLPEKVVQLLSSCDAYIADAEEGCVKLLLGFRSVEGLKKFWGIYSSGEFQECLGRELSTGDIEITEEDYNSALRKLEDASDKKDDAETNAPPALKAGTDDDALLLNPAPLLAQGGDDTCEMARDEGFEDIRVDGLEKQSLSKTAKGSTGSVKGMRTKLSPQHPERQRPQISYKAIHAVGKKLDPMSSADWRLLAALLLEDKITDKWIEFTMFRCQYPGFSPTAEILREWQQIQGQMPVKVVVEQLIYALRQLGRFDIVSLIREMMAEGTFLEGYSSNTVTDATKCFFQSASTPFGNTLQDSRRSEETDHSKPRCLNSFP